MRRDLIKLFCLAMALGACSGDSSGGTGFGTGFMDDQPPNGCDTDVCTTSTAGDGTATGATTGTPQDQCQTGADCGADQACVAEFTGTGRDVFRCVDVCLANMNEEMWCADAAACCSATAECTDRGYCVEPMGGGGSETGTGTGTGG